MGRCLAGVCAGVLLLAASGCTLDSFLSPQSVVYGPKRVVNGTVGEVNDCQVITEQHYPGIYELSDHLPTRAWLHLGPASQDRPTSGRPS